MCNGGECRWENHFKLSQKKITGKPPSVKSSGGPKVPPKGKSGGEQGRVVSWEGERIEKVMQLILLGPN